MGDPTGKERPRLRKPRHGGGLLLTGGKPGNRGGGRLPDDFYPWLRRLINDPRVRRRYEEILLHGEHEVFLRALQAGLDRLYGKAAQPIFTPEGTSVEVTLRDAEQQFDSRVDRLARRLGAAGMPEWPDDGPESGGPV
jgi:hypothetical protein